MSGYQLAMRMGLSASRVRQFEKAEVDGSIRLSALVRCAEALNCRFFYAFVPEESLDDMVMRQARDKAAAALSIADPDVLYDEEQDSVLIAQLEDLEELMLQLVDRRDLWSEPKA
jgi:predicted DNA-binding mobile mystery protein A